MTCLCQYEKYSTSSFEPYPALFLSTSPGATARTYVHVHMNSRMTSNSDWKLKSADYDIVLDEFLVGYRVERTIVLVLCC